MRVLVTGSRGFIGQNFLVQIRERKNYEVTEFTSADLVTSLPDLVAGADAVVHLAGVNRPEDPREFAPVNTDLTKSIFRAIKLSGRVIPLILASSTQAELDNPYGRSKLAAELAAEDFARDTGNPVTVYRLPGVFGKWCRPNYNSVVATFCHNIARGLPIQISDPAATIRLVYVDDVVSSFLGALNDVEPGLHWGKVEPEYSITLGELADQIRAFGNCRTTLVLERVGYGLVRALYATYVSYLPANKFAYDLQQWNDARGVFVEILKTPDAGQISYFTANPGVTRGGHFHHSKTEKFLVIKGKARFGFRHILTNETYEIHTSGEVPQVVETVPGWAHDITNVGDDQMVVVLWANEIFDRDRPDTIACKV